MSTAGLIFSNIHDDVLPELTKARTFGSIPFGGRYRLIDFTLSNMVNAGIEKIGVIAHKNYQSLLDHIGTGKDWDLARRNGGIKILPPYISEFNSKTEMAPDTHRLEELKGIYNFIINVQEDNILFSDCDVICNIDMEKIIKEHEDSNADITYVTHYTDVLGYEGKNLTIIHSDDTGRIDSMKTSRDSAPGKYDVSLNIMIYNKNYLLKLLNEAFTRKIRSMREELLPERLAFDNIREYKYTGYVETVNSMRDYFTCNLDLLKKETRDRLFGYSDRPVYTKIKNSPPTYYSPDSKIVNSFIADGCRIEGTVENSIIFRNVKIGAGAVVKNSIIMQGTTIMEGNFLNYLICDKNVIIRENRMLSGHETRPFYIGKDESI